MSRFIAAAFAALTSVASQALAQGTMSIESCNLACSSAGGGQVSCSLTSIPVDRDVRVRFSRPVDPSSLNVLSFMLIDVNNGLSVIGSRFVDATDPNVAVFRPSMADLGAGGFAFGFEGGHTYQIWIRGEALGDSPPFVASADAVPLANQTRMLCRVTTTNPPEGTGIPTCATGHGAVPCPCANGGVAHGCANSIAPLGAYHHALGRAELSRESLVLLGAQMPNSSALYFQGTSAVAGGAGTAFGDGLRCAGGTVVRLRTVTNENFGSHVPGPASPPISALGGVAAPGTRVYQIWYRDVASYCTSATWNLSNGLTVTWSL